MVSIKKSRTMSLHLIFNNTLCKLNKYSRLTEMEKKRSVVCNWTVKKGCYCYLLTKKKKISFIHAVSRFVVIVSIKYNTENFTPTQNTSSVVALVCSAELSFIPRQSVGKPGFL